MFGETGPGPKIDREEERNGEDRRRPTTERKIEEEGTKGRQIYILALNAARR
jgi:hypothetical protein